MRVLAVFINLFTHVLITNISAFFSEGYLPKGPTYIEQDQRQFKPKSDRPPIANPGEICESATYI